MCREENKDLTRKELWFWLCNIPGIGAIKRSKLLQYYGDPMYIYDSGEEELRKLPELKLKDICTILTSRSIHNIRNRMDVLTRKSIAFYSIEDAQYPEKLHNIYDPPSGIYVKGTLPRPDVLTIAVIGTRNCSPYGKEVAAYFSKELARAGVQIVSGMARGIDSYGQEGALQAGGYSLAVLGSGIDYCYPQENINLYMKLEEQGGILSEYGPGVLPKAGHFPLRNRIISGISDGILVVEAKMKSGSLITADHGLDQGKDIFSIPGRITDPLSEGTNQLIKYGAQIVSCPEDILEYYHYTLPQQTKAENIREELSVTEQQIIKSLGMEPTHIGRLSEVTGVDIGSLMEALVQLEKRKLVTQISRNVYIRVLSLG